MKVPKEESKEQNNENTINDDDNESIPYDDDSNADSIDQPTRDGDFSEYMWMENQEEFDLQVMKELEEKELMKECLEAMLDEEHSKSNGNSSNGDGQTNGMVNRIERLSLNSCNNGDQPRQSTSTLNPDAAEFVPSATRSLNNSSIVVASPS
ncbi:polyadenylate-binding protein-interacting protein 2B [Adelges cooleyi]|uniref:polyadenylate-binding protein-interacting protein 2B n=1 Tax=Adelges cooleyi TaxID=133065 RepID=UPI00217FB22D|nr:polyadenylate-binding protein-interacting protein 2B [Adelges cooleyi]XP_050433629.1 polyadenylate-binding protein-interacting protein 2B [Adelges cooleyi]XP_050433631.1 polyadenylate-binding protein-interacting protein 2B [Adelges cooleyi]